MVGRGDLDLIIASPAMLLVFLLPLPLAFLGLLRLHLILRSLFLTLRAWCLLLTLRLLIL
jgi:hypothetical protein